MNVNIHYYDGTLPLRIVPLEQATQLGKVVWIIAEAGGCILRLVGMDNYYILKGDPWEFGSFNDDGSKTLSRRFWNDGKMEAFEFETVPVNAVTYIGGLVSDEHARELNLIN